MNDELIIEKSLWKRNWKWFLPSFISILLILLGIIFSSNIDGNITDIAHAYSDNLLYEKTIEKVKTNQRIIQVIGEIEPIDKLAILEGNVIYSNNNNSVKLSVRIKGSKGKGKMDVSAYKNGNKWKFKKINIRIKNSKEEIQILKDSIVKVL